MLSTVILLSAGLSANAFHGLGVFSTCRRGSSEVLMSTATLTGKNIQLNTVKQRYSGRGDLGAPDADTDIDTYSLFAEADAD
jgi:hypothetical protein